MSEPHDAPGNALPHRRALPGDEGLWYFIFADLTLFALLFGSFCHRRALDTGAFEANRAQLYPLFATINTLLLLTSSYCMVMAVRARAIGNRRRAAAATAAAAALGVAFMISKVIEYAREIAAGHLPTSSDFFTYYYVITGIHLMHLAGGVVVLAVIAMKLAAPAAAVREPTLLESGASFWHMVDLLWLVIFPLLYLLR